MMLKMIHINFNMLKDEIDKFVSQNLSNHSNGNGSSSTRRLKFIKFSVNDRSGHSEQFITMMKMIQVNVDVTKANNTVSTPFGWRMEYNLTEKVRESKRK